MSMPHCVSSAARDIEHGREGGHFALKKRPHNLVAPNAVAYIAASQKGVACTPRDPKFGRFFFIFLDFGQISPPSIFGQPWPAKWGGGRGCSTHPRRNTPVDPGLIIFCPGARASGSYIVVFWEWVLYFADPENAHTCKRATDTRQMTMDVARSLSRTYGCSMVAGLQGCRGSRQG